MFLFLLLKVICIFPPFRHHSCNPHQTYSFDVSDPKDDIFFNKTIFSQQLWTFGTNLSQKSAFCIWSPSGSKHSQSRTSGPGRNFPGPLDQLGPQVSTKKKATRVLPGLYSTHGKWSCRRPAECFFWCWCYLSASVRLSLPTLPPGGLKNDMCKKLSHIMTLTKKLCKKIISVLS